MNITKKYTIENWKTGKIEVLDIPNEIYQLNIKDIFKELAMEGIGIGLNFIELLFFIIFKKQKWRVIRLPFNVKPPANFHIKLAIVESTGIKEEALYDKGTPDFLLWNSKKNDYRFIEIKCYEKKITKYQQKWFEKYGYDFYVVNLAFLMEMKNKKLANKEIISKNKLKRGV